MKRIVFGAVAALAFGTGAALAEFPERDLQGVIQWGAGGATDTVSRALQPHAEERLGRRLVMTNRTGGTGVLGMRYVQSQRADGYTLLFGAENPQIYKVLGLADADYADFYPVNIPARGIVVITVAADAPWQTFEELLADVQARPGEIRMGGTGPGGLTHVVETMIKSVTDFETTTVPFDGEGPGLTALQGGAVDFMPAGLSAAGSLLESGRGRALAVIDTEELSQLPGVPPITANLPDIATYLPWGPFYGVFVSNDAPEEAKGKLVEAFKGGVETEAFRTLMENRGTIVMNISGDEARAFLDRWQSVTSWLLQDAGVAVNSPEEFGIPRP
jgi:tripartite-type tricarboxylate transporter receptor subunit TctC